MFRRGLPHRRQSEGNSVANTAAARSFAPETNDESGELFRSATVVPAARVGVPLLLKTSLPRSAAAPGAPAKRIFLSIAALFPRRNDPPGALCGERFRAAEPASRMLVILSGLFGREGSLHFDNKSIAPSSPPSLRELRLPQDDNSGESGRAPARLATLMT